jgi:hypothetical protein
MKSDGGSSWKEPIDDRARLRWVSEMSALPLPARRSFEAHVDTIMRMRGLPRLEAERTAFEITLVELLNTSHPDTPSDCCAHCGRPETPDATLKPIGWGVRHAWLHDDCWEQWRTQRRIKAEDELARLGVVKP